MIFVRVFFVTVVLAAFVALGYAFWLTFQPLDAPPVSEGPDDEQMDQGPPPPTPAPPAAAGGASAMDDRPHQSAVIDQLRRPVHAAREVTAEARRIGTRIEQALPPEEDRNLEHAWRTIKQTSVEHMSLDALDGGLPVGNGRIHASGAPAYHGGGRPAARQPGMDWYKAGGAPPRE